MNGVLSSDKGNNDFDYASCDEDCPECEFADVCDWGKCMCPVGYDTHWDGPP